MIGQLPSSIPVIQIRPNSIIEYLEYIGSGRGSCHRMITEEDQEKAYTGSVTDPIAKRIKKAVNLLLQITPNRIIYNPVTQKEQPFQIAFLTLTISSKYFMMTGEEAYKKLLKHFLQWLYRTKKVNSYIWKAELQRRGQIHYHITMGNFVNYDEIRKKWNELQKREGLLDEYNEEHGHYNPNSIDIHSVWQIENLAGYLMKYIAKDQDSDPIMKIETINSQKHEKEEYWGALLSCYPESTVGSVRTIGKVWDCSKNLKEGKYFNTAMTHEHEWTLKEAVKQKLVKTITGDNYKIHLTKGNNPTDILSDNERISYQHHIDKIKRPIVDEQ